jgi:hypothetical protein
MHSTAVRTPNLSDAFGDVPLPRGLEDVDPDFMTRVLRHAGVIDMNNHVVSQEERGVGMTAGYFSAIKKVRCVYHHPTAAPADFVVKTWPALEIAPKADIQAMFRKDIWGYEVPAQEFYPRPKVYLGAFDVANDRWVLVLEDADTFADHKVHERELDLAGVMRMLPRLAEVATAWEGCHEGKKAQRLDAIGVEYWASPANLARFKAAMPGGAKLFDRLTSMAESPLVSGRAWASYLGGPSICERFTRRLDAFFRTARPENGATCTLAHGDMRGDNIFFCDDHPAYPHGWLTIDFQLMFRGPVPSDLADLMSTGSVLPEVYAGENLHRILRTFYGLFMDVTELYRSYTYEQFVSEYAMMTAIHFVYYLAFGAAIWQAGAYRNELGMRVELGGKGATEADLAAEEHRQRMWWRKCLANFSENFRTFNQYELIANLPENLDGLGLWAELPEHLR